MAAFIEIRCYLEKYRQSSLVSKTLQRLSVIQQRNDIRYPVWTLITLLKWIYTYASETNIKKPINDDAFDKLLFQVEQFERKPGHLDFKTAVSRIKSFKIIAFQQFPLQEQFYRASIDRQIVLFKTISAAFPLEAIFREKAGLSLQSFFRLCYYTYCYVNCDKLGSTNAYDGILHQDYFRAMEELGFGGEIEPFLRLISCNSAEDFHNLHRLKDQQLQLFETAFLTTKPLLYFQRQYRLPYRNIFDLTLAHFVYNFMKPLFPDSFSEDFGRRLEKYLELGLKECNLVYNNESMLKKQYNLTMVSDFLIDEDILVECKAIELHPRSGILRKQDILLNELKTSVIKAYCQLLSVANNINPQRIWFGLIVTYKETYLGFGKDAWIEFLKEPVLEFAKNNNIDPSTLPPENLIFLSVENWDHMIQLIKNDDLTLKKILLKAKEMSLSEDISEQVILFETVLERIGKVGKVDLSYLDHAHKLIELGNQA